MLVHVPKSSPACGLDEAPALQETLVGRLVALAGALCSVERLMPGTRLAAGALAAVLVEDVVGRAGRGACRWRVAHALAGDGVEVPVGSAVLGRAPALTHALTGVHVQLLIGAAHVG